MIALYDPKLKLLTERKSIIEWSASFLWHSWIQAKIFESFSQEVHSGAWEATCKNQNPAYSISDERTKDDRKDRVRNDLYSLT